MSEKSSNKIPENFDLDVQRKDTTQLEERLAGVLKEWTPKKLQEKTELTPKERFLLPLLKIIATNPYPRWSAKTNKKLRSKILLDFIDDYDSRGLSVKRQSRTEMSSIFGGLIEYIKGKTKKDETILR